MEENKIVDFASHTMETVDTEESSVGTEEIAAAVEKSLMDEQHVPGVVVEATEIKEGDTEKSFDEILGNLGEAEEVEERDFTVDDVKRTLASNNMGLVTEGEDTGDAINPKFKISDESILKLITVMNRVKNKENFNIFASLPDEVKEMINNQLKKNGMGGYSVQSNTARNSFAKAIIDEFINNVSVNRTVNDLNVEIENLAAEANKQIGDIFKDFEKERDKYLKTVLANVAEDDPKRKVLEDTLDSMYDGYKLSRLLEAVPTMKKFKSIEIEKPQVRCFNRFEDKYKDSQYKMYSMNMVLNILNKYNNRDPKENLLFLLAFCRFCEKYDPNEPTQHAFMYYTVYNIVLLDIYKDKTLEEFGTPLLQRINEIIDILVSHQNKN